MTTGDELASPRPTRDATTSGSALPQPSGSRDLRHRLFAGLAAVSMACTLVLTVVPLGATRQFAWPWTIVYAAALLGPACLVLLRAFDPARPLVLPSPAWQALVGVTLLAVLGSAAASPYRTTSLSWAAPELAAGMTFLVVFDWLRSRENAVERRRLLWQALRTVLLAIGVASLAQWLSGLRYTDFARLLAARNAFPLGHSNYTAGIAVLALPCFVAPLFNRQQTGRGLAALGTGIAAAMLFTSGSRGGAIALAAVAVLGIGVAPFRAALKWRIAAVAIIVVIGFMIANPRTRAMFSPADPNSPPNVSNVQRSAMLEVGLRMGADRPLLGWGPGTTPLAYPRYRATVPGGAENVLQLHSLPVQLFAEFGLVGVACALAAVVLLLRDARHDLVATTTLAGYAVFSVFDAQIDIPFFGCVLATLAALVAAPVEAAGAEIRPSMPGRSRWFGLLALAAVGVVTLFGRRDPAPVLNAEALRADVGRAQPKRAIELLRQSLADNPDQEIAHFNLGWLLVVDDPNEAARHFVAAAHLVPDKGGVYFGLGLARLNAGDQDGAVRAFAIEALNDPVFLLSPWWQNPQLVAVHGATLECLARFERELSHPLAANSWAGGELRYLIALQEWLSGKAGADAVAAAAHTPERRAFFARNPQPAELAGDGVRALRHERSGYPVLMRNLDIAPPIDLWVIQESASRNGPHAFVWPDKGWVPSPLVIALLDRKEPPKT